LLRLNDRMVDLRRGSVTDEAGHSITTLRPQAGEILKVLAAKRGEIVTKDELMQTVWGNIAVSDDSLVQCVIEIRKALGDDKHRILRTLPKRGYVLEAKAIDDSRNAIGVSSATPRYASRIGLAAGLGVLVMAAAVYFWPPVRGSEADRPAIAVLPFENTNGDPAGESDEMAGRERAKVAVLEEDLLAARREIDALRTSEQTARSTREEALRHEQVARRELDTIRRTAYRAGAQVRAVADEKAAQGRAFEDQRQRADQLAGNLALTLREIELLKAEAVRRREAAETS
jgi:DNA-binding winged helix-turn-helix (wHTH) protein